MSNFAKEKSWTVKLVGGYVADNQVKSRLCKGCSSTAKLVVGNNFDPDLSLYGCNQHKCKHMLIRLKLHSENEETPPVEPLIDDLQMPLRLLPLK